MFAFPFKEVKKLHQKKYRDQHNAFIVEGEKGVREAVAASMKILAAYGTEELLEAVGLTDPNLVMPIEMHEGKKISATDTFPGILAVVEKRDTSLDTGHTICLDRVADPGNLGTIIRTADWFDIHNIILSENSVDPYNPKVVRSTMGSLFRANIIEEDDDLVALLTAMKKEGYRIVALAMNGDDISTLKTEGPTVFVFGSESHGIRPEILELADVYTIPKKGSAESLNVAIAAGIVMSGIQ